MIRGLIFALCSQAAAGSFCVDRLFFVRFFVCLLGYSVYFVENYGEETYQA